MSSQWKVVAGRGSYQKDFKVVCGKKTIATCTGDQLSPEGQSIGEARQNANLIAAAPELLAALERLLKDWEESIGHEPAYMSIADHAREAIRRAQQ
jgi:hypothetical protein